MLKQLQIALVKVMIDRRCQITTGAPRQEIVLAGSNSDESEKWIYVQSTVQSISTEGVALIHGARHR